MISQALKTAFINVAILMYQAVGLNRIKKTSNVLLACPVSDYKDYIFWDWLEYIKKLSYPVDILFVDNSKNETFCNKIKAAGFKCIYLLPGFDDNSKRYSIAAGMEFIRSFATVQKYKYLFSLECDVFPPLDIIERLIEIDNPVTGALYFTNYGAKSQLMVMRLEKPEFGPTTLSRILTTDESFLFCNGTIKIVYGCGLGCVLIKNEVLQKVKFRVIPDQFTHHDVIFANDLYKLKIPVKVDTSIICKHINNDWTNIFKAEKNARKTNSTQ
jgi:hypothetical protein